MTFKELTEIARATLNPQKLSKSCHSGTVAAAILTESGKVYTGVCVDTPASMGYCAEHNAVGSMITDGESRIVRLVSVYKDSKVIPPCGRCRELIYQIHDDNHMCEVLLDGDRIVTISELLPYKEAFK